MTIDTMATFFGWCTVINIGVIIVVLGAFSLMHDWIGDLSSRMFGISSAEAKATLFHVFQQYRFAVAMLNFVPYLALKIMS